MLWTLSHRADAQALPVADRHYNRQKPGTPQFMPPGRCVVFKHMENDICTALWGSSWPFAEFVKHEWAGAWMNSVFRKECEGNASHFIREAVACTLGEWPEPPDLGMITFIDPYKVEPMLIRGVPSIGHSYVKAGFHYIGKTKKGLWVFQMLPRDMPEAQHALGTQALLVEVEEIGGLK